MSARVVALRQLRETTGAPMWRCAEALVVGEGDLQAATAWLARTSRRRDTGDPFMWCSQGRGVGRDHRGNPYHIGCPKPHGGGDWLGPS
jgi:hypothetical protein